MTAGYSGTALAKKLSLKQGMRVRFEAMPGPVRAEIDNAGLALVPVEDGIDVAHIFITGRTELKDSLERLLPLLARDGQIWVSWPKKASKQPTDVTEDGVREVALPMGLVDIKVCAVDEIWSGLKLVIRKALR
ncbi:MAG: hypothetical protein QOH04_1308 [Sphingomonadales bacterium]|jgi:hypothetical protein|nr:hypothetical protein [Sphingomonadales bacterium]MEA3035543.1 hypothetical protein [Sphingomonadales bacterium]